MNNALKLLIVAIVSVGLAACGGTRQTTEDTTPTVRDSGNTNQGADTGGVRDQPELNPNDFTDRRNIDNPNSILSQRTILFAFDQSTVRSEYRRILAAHAEFLSANSSAEVVLEGHADERGTREYNLGLGERRGNSVSDLLNAQGASGRQLSVVSYGEERPASRCSDERCWAANRRVEIVYTSR